MGIRYSNVFSFSLHGMFARENIDFSDNISSFLNSYCRLARPDYKRQGRWSKWRKTWAHFHLLFLSCSGAGEAYGSGHGVVLPRGQKSSGKYL